MQRERLSTWLNSPAAPPARSAKRSALGGPDLGLLLSSLRSGAPGQWSQNLIELSRHFTSAAYLAINTLATQAGGSTFEVYERTSQTGQPDGKVSLSWDDPISQLFENPNGQDSRFDILYQTTQQKALTGISLTWTPQLRNGDINEIYSIPSATAWPMPASPEYRRGAYRVTPYAYGMYGSVASQAGGAVIPAEQITTIKNHHPFLRYDGYAVLTACSLQVDTLEAIDLSRFNTQQLGCDQSLAIEMDAETSIPDDMEMDRLRVQLQALYSGPQNAGKLLIPPAGGHVKKFSTAPSEMAYESGWAQVLDFALACFGVPQAVAGLQNQMSFATLYSSLRAFSFLSLGPNLDQIAAAWNKQIIRPTWGMNYGLKIIPPEYKDEALEEQKISNDLKAGVRLISEIRKFRGLDHIDEPWTAERAIQTQQNEGPGGKDKQPNQDGQAEDPDVNNARPAKAIREDLLAALDNHKVNGTVKPIRN